MRLARNVGRVVHTLLPEKIRFTDDNKIGMYQNPVSVAVFKPGFILFRTHIEEQTV